MIQAFIHAWHEYLPLYARVEDLYMLEEWLAV